VLIGGFPCSIIASVTANHMEVRLAEGLSAKVGDDVVLIGAQGRHSISADQVAGWAGSSNYRILIGMDPRLPRIVSSS
jgi:alanine racemase